MLAFVAQIFLYILIGACFLAGLVFLGRAAVARFSISDDSFNVARLQARRAMMQNALGAIAFLILGLIFFSVALLFPFSSVDEDGEVAAVETVEATAVGEENGTAVETAESGEGGVSAEPTAEPTATATSTPTPAITIEAPPTPTTAPTATVEPTPVPVLATVNSPVVGLYVREVPAGEILERLEDQTAVTVLGEEQTIDTLVWVLVESPNGFVGWVARDFLLFDGPVSGGVDQVATPESGGDGG
ncbi:MAG: SH3 domain-containing protein [Sphaerospermopsis sp. SIO1G2]|nr:SH3 domain-containing protein [Sphaerospermopsis sp. SIO1G2]